MPVVFTHVKKPPVEPDIPGRNRAVASGTVHIHQKIIHYRAGHVPRFARLAQFSKIRQVVVPWASKRPLLSVMRPSAVPTRRPQLSTMPSALIVPVSGVIGRTSEILNSSVV